MNSGMLYTVFWRTLNILIFLELLAKWDFVELPSQFLKLLLRTRILLKTFAKHYQTGEVLPDEKFRK